MSKNIYNEDEAIPNPPKKCTKWTGSPFFSAFFFTKKIQRLVDLARFYGGRWVVACGFQVVLRKAAGAFLGIDMLPAAWSGVK